MKILILFCMLIIGCECQQERFPFRSRVKLDDGITATVKWSDALGYRVTYVDKLGQRHETYIYNQEIYENNQ